MLDSALPTPLALLALFPLPRFLLLYRSAGPQILTVPSSEADASTVGYTGFQVTQLTVLRRSRSKFVNHGSLSIRVHYCYEYMHKFNQLVVGLYLPRVPR